MNNKFTLKDFMRRYPDDAACLEAIRQSRWGGKISCPKCGRQSNFYKVTGRTAYACQFCGHHLYPLAGTIFDKSTTSLMSWFYAIYLMAQTRAGISAKQLERELGVTYKTAWRMFHQIRKLMADDGNLLGGTVEVDETYLQASPKKDRRLPRGKKPDRSEIVMGIVEKGGRVIARHIDNAGTKSLVDQVKAHVTPGATVHTDGWKPYRKLPRYGYPHAWIDHATGEYLINGVGTQQIENFWRQFTCGLYGVYRHVGAKYLQTYVNEYSFRYSNRKTPSSMFDLLLDRVATTRLKRA